MSWLWKVLLCELVALAAPAVCLVYRKGWFATPDDLTSPHGAYEPFMRKLYAKCGRWVGDYWWHGWRNRGYGLAYKLKPDHFKTMLTYYGDIGYLTVNHRGPLRIIEIDGFREYTLSLGFCHLIVGYRLRPVFDEFARGAAGPYIIWTRPVNMDARPVLSLRWGAKDD